MKDKRRDLKAYRRAVARLKYQTRTKGWTCWLCHEPFDWTLHPSDRDAFTADHVTPLAQGGAILGPLKPAHRRCNSSRGRADQADRVPTTREW